MPGIKDFVVKSLARYDETPVTAAAKRAMDVYGKIEADRD